MVEVQALNLDSNQVVTDLLYCLSMTPPWIVGEYGTPVHLKMDIRPGVFREIHHHYCNRRIFPSFIKGRSVIVCSQGHC